MHPADAILVLTIAAIGGLGICIGYAIAERDRKDGWDDLDEFPRVGGWGANVPDEPHRHARDPEEFEAIIAADNASVTRLKAALDRNQSWPERLKRRIRHLWSLVRDRPDETFPDEPFPDETPQRDPRPDTLLPQPRPPAAPSSGRSR